MSEISNVDAFFDAVNKAIACTPNYGDDSAAYEETVVSGMDRLRDLLANSEQQPLTQEVMRQQLVWLVAALRVKYVPSPEIMERVEEVLQRADLPWRADAFVGAP